MSTSEIMNWLRWVMENFGLMNYFGAIMVILIVGVAIDRIFRR